MKNIAFDDLPEWLKGLVAMLYGFFVVLPITLLWFVFGFVVLALLAGAFIALVFFGFHFVFDIFK